jgi:hypothetical protein
MGGRTADIVPAFPLTFLWSDRKMTVALSALGHCMLPTSDSRQLTSRSDGRNLSARATPPHYCNFRGAGPLSFDRRSTTCSCVSADVLPALNKFRRRLSISPRSTP